MSRMKFIGAVLFFACALPALPTAAAEPGTHAWLRSFYQDYRDPANYPGRAMYSGSRYGLYGYTRPGDPVMPIPRSMRKVAPPTMYHWSRSANAAPAESAELAPELDYYQP